jgi:hypothetical protein
MSVVRDFDEFQLSVPGYVVQDLDYFEPGKVRISIIGTLRLSGCLLVFRVADPS